MMSVFINNESSPGPSLREKCRELQYLHCPHWFKWMLSVLFVLACGLTLWIFKRPSPPMAYVFHAFNTHGAEISVRVEGSEIAGCISNNGCRLTEPCGTTLTLFVTPLESQHYGSSRPVKITWMSGSQFRHYLDTTFRQQQSRGASDHDRKSWGKKIKTLLGRASDAACDFPIVVKEIKP
jgi:hypothetical protein